MVMLTILVLDSLENVVVECGDNEKENLEIDF